ncbi:MAG: ABC transporter permease [Pseudomonadota bacterium]
MRAFFPIALKEFLHILRDPRSLAFALLLPLIMVLLFGYAINLDVKNVDIAVVDQDRSPQARQILSQLCADGSITVTAHPPSAEALEDMLDVGEARIGIVIPPGFGRDIASGKDAPVQILVDGSEAAFAAQALGTVASSLQHSTVSQVEALLRTMGRSGALPGLTARPRVFFNEALDSRWFVVPGLIAVIIMMLAAMITSQCVAREYERNTIEQVLVSPVRGPALMLGKLTPYIFVGIVQVASVTFLSRHLFGVPIRGSLGILAIATLLYIIGAMALGLLLSAALKSQQVAMQVSFVATILPSMLLSGFVFPIKNMPWFLQYLSYIVPARYYLRLIRGLFLKGAPLEVLWPDLLAMVIFAFVVLVAASSRFKRSL